ncbi:hypothetical protein, partial [Pseudomonas aeruginosa]|uniref:hypothetical protein n=1 Tax=Pseudomonas aeruginosa TaxID=287 RepID=UPI001E490D2E
GLFAFTGVLGIGKAHLGHAAGLRGDVDGVLFQQISRSLFGVSLATPYTALDRIDGNHDGTLSLLV